MPISNQISNFFQSQKELISDYYNLDYWETHTLSQGYAEACEQLTDLVADKVEHSSSFVQATAGSSLGAIQVLGAVPIGINDWIIQVLEQVPQGLDQAGYKLVEIPLSGLYHGAKHVLSTGADWMQGGLTTKDSFNISHEVTSTLGVAALLATGTKGVIQGGTRMAGALKQVELVPKMAGQVAVAEIGIDGVGVLKGAGNVGQGAVYMTAAKDSSGEKGKIEAKKSEEGTPKKGEEQAKAPMEPIELGKEVWGKATGWLPRKWQKRVAWGAGIVAGAEWILPEKYEPITWVQKKIESAFGADFDVLETQLNSSNIKEAKVAAVELGKIGNGKALEVLKGAEGVDFEVSQAIDAAIDQIAGNSKWIKKLQQAKDSQDKLEAIEELRQIGGNKVIEVLIGELEKEEDYEVRTHLKLAIHRVKDLYWPIVAQEFLGKDREAIWWEVEKLKNQLENQPEDETLWFHLGQAYEQLEEMDKAKEVIQKSIQLSEGPEPSKHKNPKIAAEGLHKLGYIELKEGNREQAIIYFQQALEHNKDLAEAWMNLGKAQEESGNMGAAIEAYHQATIRLERPDSGISFSLGDAYLEQQEYGLAILMYEEGIEEKGEVEDVELGRVYNQLGIALRNRGFWAKALEYYEKSVAIFKALA